MEKRVYTIVGATGNIGHVLARGLLKRGHKVKAIGRNPKKLKTLQEQGAECITCEITDKALLLKASQGSDALFSLIPPNPIEPGDYSAYQDKVGAIIAESVQKNQIPYVLDLSSVGAELPDYTGPIKGLHRHEIRLNSIPNLNVLHLRAGFFMENLLMAVPAIKKLHVLAMLLRKDLSIPMIATKDIGEKAFEFLDKLNFSGQQIFDFEGPKSYTLVDAAKIIGKKIGKPDLSYEQIPYDKAEAILVAAGLSSNFVKTLIEMDKTFNENKIKPTQKMTAEHKGKTTLEMFIDEIDFKKFD